MQRFIIQLFSTSDIGGTTFAWTRATVSGITPIGPTSGTDNPNESLTNTTTSPLTVRYVYTLAANGCTNPTIFNVDVLVIPTAVINSAATANWCNNVSNTYIATSSSSTATFAWTRAAVTGISNLAGSGSGATITETLINTTTEPVVVHYLITPSVNGCAGTIFDVAVTVNPTSIINQPVSQVVCNGDKTTTVTFATINTGGVTTYTWTNNYISIGLAATGTGNIPSFTAIT